VSNQYVQWFVDNTSIGTSFDGMTTIQDRLVEHLEFVGAALAFALLIALPVGITLGHLRRGGGFAVQLANVGRAIPILGLVIILALSPLGNGFRAVAIALGLFSIPPVLVNAYTGLAGVDDDVLEAARGMGMGTRQRLLQVELPLALPLIATGVRTAAVQLVATTTIASEVGAGGFGRYVIDGLENLDYPQVVGGAVCVIALALVFEFGLGLLQRVLTPGRVRSSRRVPTGGAVLAART